VTQYQSDISNTKLDHFIEMVQSGYRKTRGSQLAALVFGGLLIPIGIFSILLVLEKYFYLSPA